ncbi:hypothetical protein [Tessaracoccus coleopterorum]|uniref:hypothetical protein n=1 Tax=Tessaracoccus coleopterorum TaxID=2714950 RepID=UPI001E52D9AF|nr:hypothetical protein [Tessaracoccus coleopterorum]
MPNLSRAADHATPLRGSTPSNIPRSAMNRPRSAAPVTALRGAAPGEDTRPLRVALIALAGVSLITGLNAGLLRLGVWAPVASDRIADLHGPVMVLGFMGTLISLERAQALRNPSPTSRPGSSASAPSP